MLDKQSIVVINEAFQWTASQTHANLSANSLVNGPYFKFNYLYSRIYGRLATETFKIRQVSMTFIWFFFYCVDVNTKWITVHVFSVIQVKNWLSISTFHHLWQNDFSIINHKKILEKNVYNKCYSFIIGWSKIMKITSWYSVFKWS